VSKIKCGGNHGHSNTVFGVPRWMAGLPSHHPLPGSGYSIPAFLIFLLIPSRVAHSMGRKHPKATKKDVRMGRREYTVHDPAQERQVTAACKWLDQRSEVGESPNIKEALREFGVKYHILRSRYRWTHKPLKEVRASQQILSPL